MKTPGIYIRINQDDDLVVTTVEPVARPDRSKFNLFTLAGAVLLAGVAFSLLTEK